MQASSFKATNSGRGRSTCWGRRGRRGRQASTMTIVHAHSFTHESPWHDLCMQTLHLRHAVIQGVGFVQGAQHRCKTGQHYGKHTQMRWHAPAPAPCSHPGRWCRAGRAAPRCARARSGPPPPRRAAAATPSPPPWSGARCWRRLCGTGTGCAERRAPGTPISIFASSDSKTWYYIFVSTPCTHQ